MDQLSGNSLDEAGMTRAASRRRVERA